MDTTTCARCGASDFGNAIRQPDSTLEFVSALTASYAEEAGTDIVELRVSVVETAEGPQALCQERDRLAVAR